MASESERSQLGHTQTPYRKGSLPKFDSHIIISANGVPYECLDDKQTERSLDSAGMILVLDEKDTNLLEISASREAYANKDHALKLVKSFLDQIKESVKESLTKSDVLSELYKLHVDNTLNILGVTDMSVLGIPVIVRYDSITLKNVTMVIRDGVGRLQR